MKLTNLQRIGLSTILMEDFHIVKDLSITKGGILKVRTYQNARFTDIIYYCDNGNQYHFTVSVDENICDSDYIVKWDSYNLMFHIIDYIEKGEQA